MNGGMTCTDVTEQGMIVAMFGWQVNLTKIQMVFFNFPTILFEYNANRLPINDGFVLVFECRFNKPGEGNHSKCAVCFYTVFSAV